jgi:hypothetical protein
MGASIARFAAIRQPDRVYGMDKHLRHILLSYTEYYNSVRTHLSLNKDAPVSWAILPQESQCPTALLFIPSTFTFALRAPYVPLRRV